MERIAFGHQVEARDLEQQRGVWTVESRASGHRRAGGDDLLVAAQRLRLLPLRPWVPAGVCGDRAFLRARRPSSAMARGARVRGRARDRDRKRRNGRDAGAGADRPGGTRHDAAALGELCGSVPRHDAIAQALGRWLPADRAYAITRAKNIALQRAVYALSQSHPELVGGALRRGVERRLPVGYDIERHFSPTYKPWDQRLCAVPDGDLFKAISGGPRVGCHGHDRHLHRRRDTARVRRRAGGRHDRHRHRSGAARVRRDRTGRQSTVPVGEPARRRSPTRA